MLRIGWRCVGPAARGDGKGGGRSGRCLQTDILAHPTFGGWAEHLGLGEPQGCPRHTPSNTAGTLRSRMTHNHASLWDSVTALQTNLDVEHIRHIAEALMMRVPSPERPLPAPGQVAK